MPQQCPPPRACDTARGSIVCTGDKAMHSVPHIVNRTAETVVLTSNVLSSVAEGDFAGMRALESLDLTDNLITSIAAGALRDCASLMEFTINDNWLGDCPLAGSAANDGLPETLFRGLANLEYINVMDNYLTEVPETLLRGLVQLREIFFKGNCLSKHYPKTIAGLPRLTNYAMHCQRSFYDQALAWDPVSIPAGFFDNLPGFVKRRHAHCINQNESLLVLVPFTARTPPGAWARRSTTKITRDKREKRLAVIHENETAPLCRYTKFYFGAHAHEMVIEDGSMLTGLANLEELWLCCGMKEIHPHLLFKNLSKLKEIHLNNGDFTSLAPNMFADCEGLISAEFYNNGIVHVPAGRGHAMPCV